jgi:hypothetical protein
MRVRFFSFGVVLIAIGACVSQSGSRGRTGTLRQASSGEIIPILCPPNGQWDAGAEPAADFDTCSWAGWSALTFGAESGEFFVVNAVPSDLLPPGTTELRLTTEMAQSVHPWAQNAKPGRVGVIVKVARNTSSEYSTNSLLIDLVGPLSFVDGGMWEATNPFFTPLSPPLTYVGQSLVDNGAATSVPLLATGRFDTSALQVGVDTTIEVPLSPNTPACNLSEEADGGTSSCSANLGSYCDPSTCDASGRCLCTSPLINYADAGVGMDAGIVYNEYALVFHMEGPANTILLAGNDGTPNLAALPTYVLTCPEPGIPQCEGAPPGIYTPGGDAGAAIPLGYVFVRQERYEPVFNPVTMMIEQDLISSPWTPELDVALNFYMTVNDGPGPLSDADAGP